MIDTWYSLVQGSKERQARAFLTAMVDFVHRRLWDELVDQGNDVY